jgi:hypothetical protein
MFVKPSSHELATMCADIVTDQMDIGDGSVGGPVDFFKEAR